MHNVSKLQRKKSPKTSDSTEYNEAKKNYFLDGKDFMWMKTKFELFFFFLM